jgi:hypothetical protein
MRALITLLLTASLLTAAAAKPARRTSIRVACWTEDTGFDPAKLTAKVDGDASKITLVHPPSEDLMLLIVFDVVGDLARVDPARDSLLAALEKAPPSLHVGLLRAQDGLSVLLDPTADRAVLSAAIKALPISGRPGLLDTIEQSSRVGDSLIRKTGVRLAVLYITDSNIYEYREDYTNPVINSSDSRDLSRRFPEGLVKEKISKLERNIAALDTPLFIAHLAYFGDHLNEAYQTGLLQLAQATGGSAAFCRSPAEVPDAITKLMERIQSHWALDIALPEKASPNIQVVLEGADGLSYRNRFLLKER